MAPSLRTKFNAAVRVIQSLPADGPYQPSDDTKLSYYSYYQQATFGPCSSERPSAFWDSAGRAKWDAWHSLGEMTAEEAMATYVEDLQNLLETIPVNEEVSGLLELLGNFYEEVEGCVEEEMEDEEEDEEEEKKRAFTRCFASSADLRGPCQKSLMEGFGGLWEAMQKPNDNVPATGSEVTGRNVAMVVQGGKAKAVGLGEEEEEESETEDEAVEEDEEDEEEEEEEEERSTSDKNPRPSEPRLPSAASTSNSTSSSLNSQVEEEELLRCTVGSPQDRHRAGHHDDPSDVSSGPSDRAVDSDNEEFCDSVEHVAAEEVCGTSRALSSGSDRKRGLQQEDTTLTPGGGVDAARLQGDLPCEPGLGIDHLNSSLSSRGRVSGAGSRASPLLSAGAPGTGAGSRASPLLSACAPGSGAGSRATPLLSACAPGSGAGSRASPLLSAGAPGSGAGSGAPWPGCRALLCCADGEAEGGATEAVCGGDLEAQISVALARLQEAMDSVLQRLDTLEVLTASQTRLLSLRHHDHNSLPLFRQRLLWWTFHLSPVTVAFTTVWPLVAHWLVSLYLKRMRRKIS